MTFGEGRRAVRPNRGRLYEWAERSYPTFEVLPSLTSSQIRYEIEVPNYLGLLVLSTTYLHNLLTYVTLMTK